MPDPNNLPDCACMPGEAPGISQKLDLLYCATLQVTGGGGGSGNVSAFSTLTNASVIIGQGSHTIAATSTAAGFLTWMGAPSSANLRSLMTDESGTGALLFANGAFGTPTSLTLTNATGLPLTTGVTGDLPLSNLAQASAANILLGRGSAGGAGDYQEITLGANLTMTNQVLSASGGSSPALTATQVGFGSGANVLTGSTDLLWNDTSKTLTLAAGSNATIVMGGGGMILTNGAGTFTLTGDGGGADEDLTFDFNGTPNSVVLTSSTGVTTLALGTIGISTSLATVTTVSVTTTFQPSVNDGVAIGSASNSFSDLFLASGALINIANGNWVATHSSGILTVSTGDLRVTTAGTNSASVVTTAGAQTLSLKDNLFTVEPGTDDTSYGDKLAGILAGDTIAQWDLVYLDSASGRWELADSDAASSAGGVLLGLATTSGTDGNALTVLLRGIVRNDGWAWASAGLKLYGSTTPGGLTVTAPSGTDDVVRPIADTLSDDCIWFAPGQFWETHT